MSKRDFNHGFNNGILTALALMNSHGDTGGTMYEELLSMAGRDQITAAAKANGSDYEWSGLAHYDRITAQPEPTHDQ